MSDTFQLCEKYLSKVAHALRLVAVRALNATPAEDAHFLVLNEAQTQYWTYIDEEAGRSGFPKCTFDAFLAWVLRLVEKESDGDELRKFFSRFQRDIKTNLGAFQDKLASTPRCGAVLLSPCRGKLVLVLNGSGRVWNLPQGKHLEHEFKSPVECVRNEVLEETGVDIGQQQEEVEPLLTIHHSRFVPFPLHVYTFPQSEEHADLSPRSRHEISEVKWMAWKDIVKVLDNPQYLTVSSMVPVLCHEVFREYMRAFHTDGTISDDDYHDYVALANKCENDLLTHSERHSRRRGGGGGSGNRWTNNRVRRNSTYLSLSSPSLSLTLPLSPSSPTSSNYVYSFSPIESPHSDSVPTYATSPSSIPNCRSPRLTLRSP